MLASESCILSCFTSAFGRVRADTGLRVIQPCTMSQARHVESCRGLQCRLTTLLHSICIYAAMNKFTVPEAVPRSCLQHT